MVLLVEKAKTMTICKEASKAVQPSYVIADHIRSGREGNAFAVYLSRGRGPPDLNLPRPAPISDLDPPTPASTSEMDLPISEGPGTKDHSGRRPHFPPSSWGWSRMINHSRMISNQTRGIDMGPWSVCLVMLTLREPNSEISDFS